MKRTIVNASFAVLWMATSRNTFSQDAAAVVPLPQAHAHNDYRHERPLLDALDHGFCSVEADIFLVDGRLLVGHDRSELREERTLQALYLDPLRQRIVDNEGRVFPDGPPMTLLIDIKSEAEATYAALRGVLVGYRDMLTTAANDQQSEGAVVIVISGNRAERVISSDGDRHAGIDGRLSDIGSDRPVHLMPLISDRWSSHFTWRGEGSMPAVERNRLEAIVEQVHREGRRIRFWATPDRLEMWQALHDAGVDLINTDDLEGLGNFLHQELKTAPLGEASRR